MITVNSSWRARAIALTAMFLSVVFCVLIFVNSTHAQSVKEWGYANCSDTDGGENYFLKGDFAYDTLHNGVVNGHADGVEKCVGNVVEENVCKDGSPQMKRYVCPNGCKDGACIEEAKTECTKVCMPVSVANPQGHLLQSCGSNGKAEYINCPNGCENGACVDGSTGIECEGEDCPVEPKVKQKFTVYAGVEVYYKNSVFELTGEASDPTSRLDDTLDMRWYKVSGPAGGRVIFSNDRCLVRSFAAYCKTSISATKDGVYKIRLKVTNPKNITSYDDIALVWDTTAPILKEVKKIPSISNDPNPTVTFSSTAINAVKSVYNRFGDIIYGGACAGHDVSAKQGNNTIELLKLADGTYNDCTIQVQDMAGNLSNVLKISKFTIDTQPPSPPEMSQPEDDIAESSYIISGTKEAGTSVWLKNKQIVKHGDDTSWRYKVKLNSGDNSFNIFTEDLAGNNSEKIAFNVEKQKPVCTAWAYGAWKKCEDNQQTRKILSASPKNCVGGKPEVSKDCKAEKNKPECESYNYSAWSKCINKKQTRTIESASPDNCRGGESPVLSKECGDNSCDFVNYTAWGSCNKTTGKKTRQIESLAPEGCVPQNSVLSTDCNGCESYNYSTWSACVNNVQTRTIESTLPADCHGGVQPVLSQVCGKSSCDFVYYTTWSACDKTTGKRTRKIESTVPKFCVPENPELTKDCNACESYNYSMWSTCVNNVRTRSVESTFPSDCSGGVQSIKSRECGKSACDFVYYTTWSACDKSTGQRTRKVDYTVPSVCVVENPWLSKDCNACESFNYSMWSACVGNVQTRTVESTFPSDCSGGAQPLVSRECGKEFCDFVYYTTWSTCNKSTGQRTRQVESTSPAVCVVESPWLTKDCDPCESYNYSAWSKCDANGVQHRTLDTDPTVAPTFPADCYGGAQPVYTRTCPPCDSWIYSSWSACVNGQQTRTIEPGTALPLNCWGGSPVLTRACN